MNVEKVIEVIKKDANGRGYLCYGNKKMCILGGLLHAAGVPVEAIKNKQRPEEVMWDDRDGYHILELEYGIDEEDADFLMEINDAYSDTRSRRKVLIHEIQHAPKHYFSQPPT